MRLLPIENLLKYNQNILDEYKEFGVSPREQENYVTAKSWVDCIKYVLDNYDCIPKDSK